MWVPATTLYALITWLSNQASLPGTGDVVGDWVWFKSGHLIAYGVLTLLVWIALRVNEVNTEQAILSTWYAIMLAATLDEFHQGFVMGRTSRPLDVFIDLVAAWAVLQVVSRYNRRDPSGM